MTYDIHCPTWSHLKHKWFLSFPCLPRLSPPHILIITSPLKEWPLGWDLRFENYIKIQ